MPFKSCLGVFKQFNCFPGNFPGRFNGSKNFRGSESVRRDKGNKGRGVVMYDFCIMQIGEAVMAYLTVPFAGKLGDDAVKVVVGLVEGGHVLGISLASAIQP